MLPGAAAGGAGSPCGREGRGVGQVEPAVPRVRAGWHIIQAGRRIFRQRNLKVRPVGKRALVFILACAWELAL